MCAGKNPGIAGVLFEFFGFEREYLYIDHRAIIAVDSHVGDGIDDVHPFVGLTEYGVVTIEMWCSFCSLDDEELASVRIRTSIGHGEGSFEVCKF